ncbi:MAG TPA: hypothetical protein VKG26_12770 [Bacteroidia bacterium]|nr:hypothetical protein [Bacteroidia bacterium]
MKKIIPFAALYVSILVSACSPKTTTALATTTNTTTAPAAPTTDVTSIQVDAAKKKYPDATTASLQKGHDVYYGASCTGCHGAKKITNFSEDDLPGIINRMARKAQISDEEKDAVLKYVMGVKLAAK